MSLYEDFSSDLIIKATLERFGPIVTSAAALAAMFLPLLVLGNRVGHEIAHPMSIVILGGLISSLLFNLYVVPTLYLRFGSRREPEMVFVDEDAVVASAVPAG